MGSTSITPTSITSSSTVNQRNPNIITFNNGKIEFIQSNSGERLDLPNSHFLKEIRIFSTENSQEVLRKVIKFSYGYFTHISTGQNKRLRLTKVSFQNPTGTVIEEYIPEYWTNTLSWDENTDREKIDFYGYFNGQPNAHLIAVSQYNGVPVLGGAANRATVSTYMKNGVLKKITYPSGGYTEFDYEPNQANFGSGAQLVGGLRVTSIKSTTGNSSFIKRYQYGLSGNSIGNFTTNWTPNSAISPNIQQLIYVGSQQGFPVTSRASMASFTQNGPSLEMNTMDSAPVYYTHVTEYQEDSSDPVKNGRIEYVFDFRVDLISNNFSFVSRDVQPWKRGNLISKTTYSNNNQILHKLENTYQELKASTQVRGGSVLTAHVYEGPLVPRSTIPCPTTFLTSPPGESGGVNPEMSFTGISYQSGINLVTQTIETLDGLATKKSMSYNAHLAISESFIEGSITGESRGDVFKYSSDPTFSGIASINSLVNRNQMTEIIEKETRDVINGVTSVLYKEKTNYGSFTGTNGRGQNTLILPTDIQVAPTGGILETRIIFSSYDPTGNLTSYQVDKIPFVVLYGYSNSLVQAVIRNASLAQVTTALQQNGINSAAYSVSTLNTTQLTNIRNFQNSLSGSLTEWYTHIPHVGLSQRVSSNGLRTNFFYNDFLRLTKITDEDGNIDRIYQYQISPTQTFIQTVSPLKPLNTESLAQQTSNSLIDIQYFDGLGRPTQQIGVNQSPTLFSIVKSFIQYDKFNRPSISFLPTPLTTGGSQQQTSIQTNASSFYNDTRPFSSTTYEASPTNRPIQVLGVGNAWESNNKTTTIEYTSAGNNVRRYQIQSNNTVLLNGNYPANSLAQKKIIDEQGHATIEIYDRYSRLIQRQVQVDNTSYLTTAYCYDGLGRVRAVVTPTIFNQNQSIIVSSTSFSDGVYAYEYDSRGRIQRKHVPGAGWTNYVYDLVDQVVLEQTPEQGISGRWSYTMYDAFSRITSQGELTNSSSQVTLQSLFNQVVSPFETWNSTTKTYSKGSFPSSVVTNNEQEVLFYDQYDWVTDANLNYSTVAQINGQGYWSNSRGNPTGGHVRSSVNSSSPILPLVLYYDKKNRLIQKHQGHVAGGNTPAQFPLTTNYEYNHDGTVSKELTKYNFESLPPLNVQTNNTFDFSARLTSILHGINSSPDSLWKISYDEIGRVNKKQLSGTAQPLQLRLKALLQMPVLQIQSDSLMSDALRVGNNGVSLIPLNPPTVVPFNQIITPVGPISPSVLTAGNGGPDSIVDWVMVELRFDTNMCARVDARAALIQRDGDVVDVDGTSPVAFSSVPIGNYYVILRHRNHLGVMSANPITFPQNNILDFRLHSTPTYSISTINPLPAQVNLTSQFRAAWGGDADGDGTVNFNLDKEKIYQTVVGHPNNPLGLSFYKAYGYNPTDINFDKLSVFAGSGNDVSNIQNIVLSHPANISNLTIYLIRQQLPTCPNLTTVSFVSSENSTSQQLDYSWHIRGGLRGINLDPSGNVALNTTQKDVFSYRLDYETAGQWDGNISKQTWLSSDQPVSRSFTFAYDPSKRLTQAIYNGSSGENFTVDQLTYDANSQIKTLRRFGAPGGGVLDNLSYTHQGMRLSQVSDAQTNTLGGFIPRGQGNYSYNSLGQLTSDQNEQIQQISYNSHLKLPTQVILTDGRKIEYSYSGAGVLMKTEYFSAANQSLERWEYIGDLVLRNGALFQVAVPNGRAVFANGSWNYELHYTDHLGNVRATINRQGQLISSSHFDPWGHRLQGLGTTAAQLTNRWELQGKERDLTFGLNRINFGARVYNPTIGVWDQVDPLADEMPSYSPYSFGFNNPVRFIDPDGRAPFDITLLGANNSSVTVKTNLVDLKINTSSLGVDFGGNYTLSGNDVLQAVVDIGGVFDPTPTLDILGASLSAKSGDYWGAAASGLGAAVPYVGDLAKSGKIAKGIDNISDAIGLAKSEGKAFGAAVDTESKTAKQAFNKAKDQNGIPRSQQPDKQYSVPDKNTGKPLRQYDYTNSKGEKISIRKDNPVTYPDGGKQGPHYNAGKSGDKLKQHHNYE